MRRRQTKITIRSARPKDARAVLDLWKVSGLGSSATDDVRCIQRRLKRDRHLFLVAVDRSRVVATLIAGWDGWRGSMARLAVHPSHRRRRIAQQLVGIAEARLRKLGAIRIGALVVHGNRPAERFWRKAGYELQPEIGRFGKSFN